MAKYPPSTWLDQSNVHKLDILTSHLHSYPYDDKEFKILDICIIMSHDGKQRIIGLSTGCLYNWDPEVISKGYDGLSLLLKSEMANAVEILFYYPETILNSEIPDGIDGLLSKFVYRSIHAPWVGIKYDGRKRSKEVLEKLAEHAELIHANAIVFHVPNVSDMEMLNQSDLPILIENTRKRKRGYSSSELAKILDYDNLGYVLDVAHLFQTNIGREEIKQILILMEKKLREIHVSGFSSSNKQTRQPLYQTNMQYREKIIATLGQLPNLPIIIESRFRVHDVISFDEEINFIQNSLDCREGTL